MANKKITDLTAGGTVVDADLFESAQNVSSTPVSRKTSASQVYTYINGKLNVGNLTATGSAGLSVTNGTNSVINGSTSITQQASDTTHNGYLSSVDWNTFNSKQTAGDYLTGLTGDVAALGPGISSCSITFGAVTDSKVNASANIALTKINTNPLGKGYGASISGNITLTNPCNNFFSLINTTGTVTLPRLDNVDSLSSQQNSRIIFRNIASGDYTINDFNGDFLLTIPSGKVYEFIPKSNSVNLPAGQWAWIDLSFIYSSSPPLNVTDGVITINQANASQGGYLSSTDWNTFNSKQTSGNYITALTGDVTASGPGSVASTIANSAVTNSKMSNMAATTIKGNSTASPAAPSDLSASTVLSMLSLNIPSNQITYGTGTGLTSTSTFYFDGTNLGIGTNTPHAPLQFSSTLANRKIVLFEQVNDDHEYIGMGVNSFAFRFQIEQTTSNFVFYAATSSTTSNEVFRIKGNGISVTPSGGGIQFGNSTASYSPTTLDYYEKGTFSVNFSGAATISSVTVTFIRIGTSVTLYFGTRTTAASANSSLTTGSGAIPTRLRPASSFDCDGMTWIMDNSVWQSTPGRAVALVDGTIQIYKANVNIAFTNAGNCGFGNTYLRYICS